jgi:hypothetical protein
MTNSSRFSLGGRCFSSAVKRRQHQGLQPLATLRPAVQTACEMNLCRNSISTEVLRAAETASEVAAPEFIRGEERFRAPENAALSNDAL